MMSIRNQRDEGTLRDYVSLMRPDHWFKNLFAAPGLAFGILFAAERPISLALFTCAVLSMCAISSANYVINEWLDAASDTFHPVKKFRASVRLKLNPTYIYTLYSTLLAVGGFFAYQISHPYFYTTLLLAVMGVLYNVRPIRTKDVIYLDVLSEAVNNPIRFLLGWFLVANAWPPTSSLLAYWFGGAYLMALKRFAEYRFITDKSMAVLYRKSFGRYDETKLLVSAFFYANACNLFLGVFLIKYRAEYLLAFPFIAWLFASYMRLSLKADSPAQRPERLYRERHLMAAVGATIVVVQALTIFDLSTLLRLLGAFQVAINR